MPRLLTALILLAFSVHTGLQAESQKNPAAAPAEKSSVEAPEAKTVSADEIFSMPPPADLNGFGSDEPASRPDMPDRGIIKLGPKDFIHNTMAHWEQFDWTTFEPKRWGRYAVRLTYTMHQGRLPLQFRLGDQVIKTSIPASRTPKQYVIGKIYIEKAEYAPFTILCPTSNAVQNMRIIEVAFVPAPESDDPIAASSSNGTFTLPAKAATTWSEKMRFEPKPEKNCLGFWTETDDLAEWEFISSKPGRYKVTVRFGCGDEKAGSKVQLRYNGQKLDFKIDPTGGYQNWQDKEIGEIEIRHNGMHRIAIQPLEKKGSAVFDVHSITLSPAT